LDEVVETRKLTRIILTNVVLESVVHFAGQSEVTGETAATL
jgi:hypothetical protein